MNGVLPYLVLGVTVSLSLARPKIGRLHIDHTVAGALGAFLTVSLGLVSPAGVVWALELLARPVITIVSLMVITLIAEHAGIFNRLARRIARGAKGSGTRLFALLFFAGTLTGTFFTNDAAALIFTPLVFKLVEDVQDESWTLANKLPYYFGVLYVANLVGALVIANPINLVTASILKIGFAEYARWMIVPALVSMVVSFAGLRLYFRGSVPARINVHRDSGTDRESTFFYLCAIILGVTLIGFFSEGITEVPVWAVALGGAIVLSTVRVVGTRASLAPILKGVGWDVIVFVIGIFIVAMGLRNAGLATQVGHWLLSVAGDEIHRLTFAVGFTAAISSALIDNHPTADMMAWIIRDFSLPALQTKLLAFAALIGGDLGPKMSPIGSLAALMWLRLLRDRGVDIPYRMFISINIPVTLTAVLLSLVTLSIEIAIYETWLAG